MPPYVDFYGGASTQTPPHARLWQFNSGLAATSGTDTWTTGTLDSSVSKWGGASMKVTTSGADNAYNFGQHFAGSWTLEGWFRTNNFQLLQLTIEVNRIGFTWNTAAGTIGYSLENGTIANTSIATSITADAFAHWAIVRNKTANIYTLYFNGGRLHETASAVDVSDHTDSSNIVASQATDAWVDDLRFSPSALYSGATYTIPSAFPT